MSTTAVSAGQVMDRVAALLNDPSRTDYTYAVMLPYLNMAIEELSESMEETNNSPSTTVIGLNIPVGPCLVTAVDDPNPPVPPISVVFYPTDLTEIQEIREAQAGTTAFRLLDKKEILQLLPQTNSLLYWMWVDQRIAFNPAGSNTPMTIQLTYVRQGIPYVASELSMINMINSRSFLAFKTAALCARYIGENESRAEQLDGEADDALERTTTISNKGRQQIMTRHKPFRAGYKMRGWY